MYTLVGLRLLHTRLPTILGHPRHRHDIYLSLFRTITFPRSSLFFSLSQSHNSFRFFPCLILVKILPRFVSVSHGFPREFSLFLNLQRKEDSPRYCIFTYPPRSLGTKIISDRLLLSSWTLQGSLQPVPANFLAEPSSWPDALLTSPTAPALDELHTTLVFHPHLIFRLHLNIRFHRIQPPLIPRPNSPHTTDSR